MNNRWNRFIYRLWSPIYDSFFNKGPFLKARREIFETITFNKDEKVLFVGVGTGADIELIPYPMLKVTAIDYSEEMLHQAKKKFPSQEIVLEQMDAQDLKFPADCFDYVIASLILSVVPDRKKAFAEMVRVLRPNGQILIFDKFSSQKPSVIKNIIRPVVRLLGTDIGLSFEDMMEHQSGLTLLEDHDVMFRGMYRKIKIRKH